MIDRALQWVRRTNSLFALAACGLALVIVMTIVVTIVMRSLGAPIVWGDDIAQIAFLYLFLLALGPALESGHHVTVELFDPLVPARLGRYLSVIAPLIIAVFSVILLMQLWRLTGRSFATGRLASTVLPIPLKWLQLAGPIGVVQLCITAIAIAVAELRTLVGAARAGEGTQP